MKGTKDSEEGKESLGGEKRISTEWITMFLLHGCYWGKENEKEVLDTPSCVEVPEGSLAGRNMMGRVLKKEAGWLRLEEKSVGVESGIGSL